jgi:hypothetical protein
MALAIMVLKKKLVACIFVILVVELGLESF